jgi:hypothetical protein
VTRDSSEQWQSVTFKHGITYEIDRNSCYPTYEGKIFARTAALESKKIRIRTVLAKESGSAREIGLGIFILDPVWFDFFQKKNPRKFGEFTGRRFLVDTGAAFSILPHPSSDPATGQGLIGPSGSPIRCWGLQ